MGIIKKFFNNAGRPEGILGKFMVSGMNKGHAKIAEWGLSSFDEGSDPRRIIELGCGGGQNVKNLLEKYPGARIMAFDYSEVSLAKTRSVNKDAVEDGRVRLRKGNVGELPFKDERFDMATAFETVYFWPGPVLSFKEVWRVLKPGGVFIIVNASDGTTKVDKRWSNMIDHMRLYTKKDLEDYLYDAGFKNVIIEHNADKHWLCAKAYK
ncbi:MAG: class I SAM-dependent methyltransferase [Clostridiales bacterium]|nr:class I SAM-dependent methyltransferase [Clostridiales bacterium]MBS5878239.1 class I SAM-dependent methyltransferase [Clostridiales bacterium]MDU0939564.1 class I SAM-dependent methyltransferase [Clostridiales bacterium]MDU1041414.1 class I SAM-dependent methyltransferase [Clostridiales bacterium]MDU3489686.1 class I SAM-dependent methyltransferase [Clostridiales bacterium]